MVSSASLISPTCFWSLLHSFLVLPLSLSTLTESELAVGSLVPLSAVCTSSAFFFFLPLTVRRASA